MSDHGTIAPAGPEIDHLTRVSVEKARAAATTATREELIAAHRWCDRNLEGNKGRRAMLAAALCDLAAREKGGAR